MTSPAQLLVERLRPLGPEGAHRALDMMLRDLTPAERAGLEHNWRFWARPKQLFPSTPWRSIGFLTGRGFGKTRAISEFLLAEMQAGRAERVGLCAQNEDKTLEVMVHGKSGLVTISPPWFKLRFESGRVIAPNGAQAFIYTPEKPGDIRGPEHDHFWATELVAWAPSTRDEAWSNARRGCRLGVARTVWDTTPKRRHPLIRALLARSAKRPDRHIVIRGETSENIANLNPEEVAEWYEEIGGTQQGDEELRGVYSDDDSEALFQQAWIDAHRRDMPAPGELVRRIIVVDPAISTGSDSDATGMGELGLARDGQVLVIDDMSSKHAAHRWAEITLDRYVAGGCDLVVAETNRGGNLVTQNLRAIADKRGLRIEVVDEKWTPHRASGVVHVREVNARGSKAFRAAPVATYYQRGRVSHVRGANLVALETLMTTWTPPPEGTRGGRRSPDPLDAVVHGVVELAGLRLHTDARVPVAGFTEAMRREVQGRGPAGPGALSALLRGSSGGGPRI